tara:strand:+ start:4726 stop:5019 length:294 start_codon:yes stop_codon:yes gene_type:complete
VKKEMSMNKRLNISRLIEDLGGVSSVAKLAGVVRTAPYGWVNRHYLSSPVLEKIKSAHPELDLNSYFENELMEKANVQDETGSGSGISGERMVDNTD